MFPDYFWHEFSAPHEDIWQWASGITETSTPRPFVALWSRARGKSTNAEAIAADMGARGIRTYCMYVSGTQDQADKHVQTIAWMLESKPVTRYYPAVGEPLVGKNGSRTWNRRIVTTANGFTVEAVGLNKAVRGQKVDWARPDLIIFDDVDEKHDTEKRAKKKEEIITGSILPAGSSHCAVLFVQNLIHDESIASQLAAEPGTEGAAGYLMDRYISGPFPAVRNLKYETQADKNGVVRWVITEGQSIWGGFDLDICESELNRVGPPAYLLEYQHDIDGDNVHALMSTDDFERTRVNEHPDLAYIGIGVDPPGGATECGIVCSGRALIGRRDHKTEKTIKEWHGFTLEDASTPPGVKPEQWALAVLKCYYRNDADAIYVERNYGGDMVSSTIRQAKWVDNEGNTIIDGQRVNIIEVVATRGKQVRAQPVALAYQQGRAHHVGRFDTLEKQWRTWVPGEGESPNRLDAEVWVYTGLNLVGAAGLPTNQPAHESRWKQEGLQGETNSRRGNKSRWKRY